MAMRHSSMQNSSPGGAALSLMQKRVSPMQKRDDEDMAQAVRQYRMARSIYSSSKRMFHITTIGPCGICILKHENANSQPKVNAEASSAQYMPTIAGALRSRTGRSICELCQNKRKLVTARLSLDGTCSSLWGNAGGLRTDGVYHARTSEEDRAAPCDICDAFVADAFAKNKPAEVAVCRAIGPVPNGTKDAPNIVSTDLNSTSPIATEDAPAVVSTDLNSTALIATGDAPAIVSTDVNSTSPTASCSWTEPPTPRQHAVPSELHSSGLPLPVARTAAKEMEVEA